MSIKKNVYFGDNAQKIIEARYKEQESGFVSFSGQVNEMLDRYNFIMKTQCPQLSDDEWTTILNVYSGCIVSSYNRPYRIASDMMDNVGEVDINEVEKQNPDYAALVKKAYHFSQIEQMAVLDFVQVFWSNQWGQEYKNFTEIKEKILSTIG